MQIIEKFITNSQNFKVKQTIVPKGIMLHSVGVPQSDPEVFVKTFNTDARKVGVHAFYGPDERIFQTLPWTHRAWHCGGKCNDTHIGVEMTEPNTIKYTGGASFIDNNPEQTRAFVHGTYNMSVKLFSFLCKKFNLNPIADGVILSHSEGFKRGLASNHGDVEHLWKFHDLTMDGFRRDVNKEMQK